MCRHCGETVDHFLLLCEMAYWLWSFVFITFGLSWVIPISILGLLFGWGSICLRFGTQPRCASYGVFGRNGIGRLLRIWIAPVIRCLLLLVELFLIGLKFGDSHLVIPSLLFFAPFLFCNYSVVWLSLMFFLHFLLLVLFGFALCSSCIEQTFVYISFLLKKKKELNSRPLASKARIIPLNQTPSFVVVFLFFLHHKPYH